MEAAAGRLPFQAAHAQQAPGLTFEVVDQLFVNDLMNGNRQYRWPVLHEPVVLPKTRGDVFRVVGPTDTAEVGHPARYGHVAQIAPAVNEGGLGKKDRQKTQIHVVVGHLVHDMLDRFAVRDRQSLQVTLSQLAKSGVIQPGNAEYGGLQAAQDGRNRFKGLPSQAQFAGAVDARVAGQHLFDQRCPRTGQPEDEHGPAGGQSRTLDPSEELRPEGQDQVIDEALMFDRVVRAFLLAGQIQGQGIGTLEALRGAGEVTAIVQDMTQGEEEPGPGTICHC